MSDQIHKVKKVKEVLNESQVNRYLDAGWILIDTVAQREGNDSWIKYSLGWTKESPPTLS